MKNFLAILTFAVCLTSGAEVINDLFPYARGTYDADFWDTRNHTGVVVAQDAGAVSDSLVMGLCSIGNFILAELETRWMHAVSAIFSCETGAPGFVLYFH